MITKEMFETVQRLLTPPIPADAVKQLNELRKQVPAEDLADFDWFYEALMAARD